jgi:transcriptional regulator of arginine metabolism
MKKLRQAEILRILEEESPGSQGELVRQLKQRGFDATQATVSRDLLELNVARVHEEGGSSRYVQLEGQAGPVREDELGRVLRTYLLRAEASGNLMVLRTAPGNAQPLALGLDRAEMPEVLGTVAGDDTIICVIREGSRAARVAENLRDLARGRKAGPTKARKEKK